MSAAYHCHIPPLFLIACLRSELPVLVQGVHVPHKILRCVVFVSSVMAGYHLPDNDDTGTYWLWRLVYENRHWYQLPLMHPLELRTSLSGYAASIPDIAISDLAHLRFRDEEQVCLSDEPYTPPETICAEQYIPYVGFDLADRLFSLPECSLAHPSLLIALSHYHRNIVELHGSAIANVVLAYAYYSRPPRVVAAWLASRGISLDFALSVTDGSSPHLRAILYAGLGMEDELMQLVATPEVRDYLDQPSYDPDFEIALPRAVCREASILTCLVDHGDVDMLDRCIRALPLKPVLPHWYIYRRRNPAMMLRVTAMMTGERWYDAFDNKLFMNDVASASCAEALSEAERLSIRAVLTRAKSMAGPAPPGTRRRAADVEDGWNLHRLARAGNSVAVLDMLRDVHEFDVCAATMNTTDDNGSTPLSIAIARQNLSMCAVLLERRYNSTGQGWFAPDLFKEHHAGHPNPELPGTWTIAGLARTVNNPYISAMIQRFKWYVSIPHGGIIFRSEGLSDTPPTPLEL